MTHSIPEAVFLSQQVLVLATNPGRVRELVATARCPIRARCGSGRRPTSCASPPTCARSWRRADGGARPGRRRDAQVRASRVERRRRSWRDRLPPIVAALGLLAAWQLGAWAFGLPIYIAPTPVAGADARRRAADPAPQLPADRGGELHRFLVGNTAAILLAVVFIHSKRLEAAFYPIAVFVNTILVLAKAPILVLIFGLGMTSKVVIAAFICFFPTLANMVRGLQSVNRSPSSSCACSASRAEVFWKLRCRVAAVPLRPQDRVHDLGAGRDRRGVDRRRSR